jgi:hypothetical protein
LASGSLNNLSAEKCKILSGRKVVLFPDLNGFEKWSIKAKELSHIASFTVSDLLERKATKEDRKQGLDLADYLIKIGYCNFNEESDHPNHEPVHDSCQFQQQILKRQRASWTMKEVEDLDLFFSSHVLPQNPFQLDQCTKVVDGERFVQSTLDWIKSHCGNDGYTPYYEQLLQLKDYLKKCKN